MDVDDPAGNGNFYDEIDSFMPPPGDFNLDDIDEILRSTNPELDATLGFADLEAAPNEFFNFNIKNEFTPINETATTYGSNSFNVTDTLQNYDDAKPQLRNDSISSMDGETFNPDEFMNFLNDDSMKLEDFTADSDCSNNSIEDVLQRHRNTPSPTGSCSSSGGSSTSGVQSDASSVGSMTPAYNHSQTEIKMTHLESSFMEHENSFQTPANVSSVNVSISAPVNSTKILPTTSILTPQIIQMPVRTVPVNTLNLAAPKSTLKSFNNATPTVKFVNANAAASNNVSTAVTTGKITPPANAKPKTIFLSSNDFKTLMQRMNTNGTKVVGGGAKITGAINAQMPKIIMKTPNGKVITTNKIVQPLNAGNNKTVMSKIVTANGAQLVLKQHGQTKTESNNPGAVYKGIIDEKLLKKQQRMIKNRESASLSRKKKREYVVSLETRINNLEKENYCLKGENKSLRSQLVALAQTCRCKNGNVSEFILNSLNAAEQKSQPVKIAPKPAPKSLKQRMTAANIRKNVAVLFAMAFMVSLNVGNFQNFLNKSSLEAGMAEQTAEEPLPQVATAAGGRRLLWVETETEYNEKLNRSKREAEAVMPPPPLHFLKPINRTAAGLGNSTTQHDIRNPPIGTNQTENLRIASNLRKWIGGNANYLNLSLNEQNGNFDDDLENPTGFRATADYYDMKHYDLPLQQGNGPGGVKQQKRKFYVDDGMATAEITAGKQRKFENDELDNSLDIFKPKISDEYLRLFKGIKRQDDTFYVLSFNMDHILLPASNYNKSARPKMALMLPAGDPALNGDVTLMQIDCEVTNTTELMLKSFMIPEKLRPSTYAKHANDVSSNDTAGASQAQQKSNRESRFYRQAAASASVDQEVEPPKKPIVDKIVAPKQKPVVRTFYLMGPKTQAAADASKKKPTIVKLSSNETIVNGVVSVRNSTLFTKMRDTVAGDVVAP